MSWPTKRVETRTCAEGHEHVFLDDLHCGRAISRERVHDDDELLAEVLTLEPSPLTGWLVRGCTCIGVVEMDAGTGDWCTGPTEGRLFATQQAAVRYLVRSYLFHIERERRREG